MEAPLCAELRSRIPFSCAGCVLGRSGIGSEMRPVAKTSIRTTMDGTIHVHACNELYTDVCAYGCKYILMNYSLATLLPIPPDALPPTARPCSPTAETRSAIPDVSGSGRPAPFTAPTHNTNNSIAARTTNLEIDFRWQLTCCPVHKGLSRQRPKTYPRGFRQRYGRLPFFWHKICFGLPAQRHGDLTARPTET